MSKRIKEQSFGGIWTIEKLDALEGYLHSFNTALKKQPFKKIYIDGFAGNGECKIKSGDNIVSTKGSTVRALNTTPSFDELYFIERDKNNVKQLEVLAADYSSQKINIVSGDANQEIIKIINSTDWKHSRGVLLLDPFGMTVEWPTLEKIANTKAIDLWYLFPINALLRQAANNLEKVESYKADKITACLGTNDWIEKFYQESEHTDLLDTQKISVRIKHQDILSYVQNRLGSIFANVLEPVILKNANNAAMFALFFACSNPSRNAIKISGDIAKHLLDSLETGKLGTKEKKYFDDLEAKQKKELESEKNTQLPLL